MSAPQPAHTGRTVPDADTHRRRVRVFVALHVGAVLVIYGLALSVGGGLMAPPVPPDAAMALAPAPARVAVPLPAWREPPATPAATPAWTQRAEVAAPWHEPPAGGR